MFELVRVSELVVDTKERSEDYLSFMKHEHYRLDKEIAERNIRYPNVYQIASIALGKSITCMEDMLKLSEPEHRKIREIVSKEGIRRIGERE